MSPTPSHILVVDDEEHLAAGISENLVAEGYKTDVAHDGEQALAKIRANTFDLIVLDVMMPKIDGLKVCEEIRADGLQTPVLFLTVKGDPADRIRGLEAGGDDYLSKPFHLKELLLRVEAILRRTDWYKESNASLSFGGNEINFKTYPSSTTTTSVTRTVVPTTEKFDIRGRGRQANIRIDSDAVGDKWRYGTLRLDVQPDGGR